LTKSRARWKASPSCIRDVNNFLSEHNISQREKLIGVNLQRNMKGHSMPDSYVQNLVKELTVQFGTRRIMLIADKNTNLENFRLSKEENKKVILFSPRSIAETAAVLEKCFFFITLNNANYHLSVYLGIPSVGLFENGEEKEWAVEEQKKSVIVSGKKLKSIEVSDVMLPVIKLVTK
jgi:ADP-heptose:LPS heptosyltransferase